MTHRGCPRFSVNWGSPFHFSTFFLLLTGVHHSASVLGSAHGSGYQVYKERIFEQFAGKSALAKAINIPIEHVSWDIPSWTDW